MIPTAKVLLFPELRKFFTLFAQISEAITPKAAPESLQLKYGFFYVWNFLKPPAPLKRAKRSWNRAFGSTWNARQRKWNAL